MPRDYVKKYRSSSDPTVDEDEDTGYCVGDEWINTATDVSFVLMDSSSGAAIWRSTNNYLFTPYQYRDLNVSGFVLSGPAATLPGEGQFKDSTGTDTGITTRAFDVGEGVDGALELQHDYAEGTDVTFHLHWQGLTAPAGGTDNVRWQLIYTFGRTSVALPAATTITVETAITTQYALNVSAFAAISGTSRLLGDQFCFRLSRIAASTDEYAGLALIATVGLHYQVNSHGSAGISTK